MLLLMVFTLVFSTAITNTKETTVYYGRETMLSVILSIIICNTNNYIMNLDKGVSLYGGLFNITSLTQCFQIFVSLVSISILVYNSFYHRNLITHYNKINTIFNKKKHQTIISLGDHEFNVYKHTEYSLIILFAITGASFLMCSGDLISLFISIELQSYALYILSTIHRESEQSTWGGLTYYLLGGLSSCFILLGSALLYINSGTTSLEGLYIITAISEITPINNQFIIDIPDFYIKNGDLYNRYYIDISLILISVGLLFKISAAPFHFWSPDVYDALPTAVTTYVAIIPKISIFIILLDLVHYINVDDLSITWKNIILISSLLSLIIGSLLGLAQNRIKKILAYSTISHVGFILLALCVNNTESVQAYTFYILSYTISNLNAFLILITIGYQLYLYVIPQSKGGSLPSKSNNKTFSSISEKFNSNINLSKDIYEKASYKDSNIFIEKYTKFNSSKLLENFNSHNNLKDVFNSPLQLVNQLKGFYFINPYLCLSLTITLFSFIGIPPLVGFFAKQMVLSAALDNGYIFITLIAIITSVIGAVYYLNIVKLMFFFKPDYVFNPSVKNLLADTDYFGKFEQPSNDNTSKDKILGTSSALSIIISILSLALTIFILVPNQSINIAKTLSLLLFY